MATGPLYRRPSPSPNSPLADSLGGCRVYLPGIGRRSVLGHRKLPAGARTRNARRDRETPRCNHLMTIEPSGGRRTSRSSRRRPRSWFPGVHLSLNANAIEQFRSAAEGVMIVAYTLSAHDDGTHMLGDETYRPPRSAGFHDWRFGKDGVPHPATCPTCGRKTDSEYVNPKFKARRRTWDISHTCDGYVIVSKHFREFCEKHGWHGMTFLPLPADKDFLCPASFEGASV
jgi:hypothetical protein